MFLNLPRDTGYQPCLPWVSNCMEDDIVASDIFIHVYYGRMGRDFNTHRKGYGDGVSEEEEKNQNLIN